MRIVTDRQLAPKARRFLRGRRFDRNPLRRRADRAETTVLALLLVAFLVGAPLAALATLMRLVVSGQLDAARFVTHRFDLNDFEKAYEVFSRPETSAALKVVLTRGARGEGW